MIVAIDTGGTKTLVAGFGDDGAPQKIHRFPTPKDIVEYIKTLSDIFKSEFTQEHVKAISIASRGYIEGGTVVSDDVLSWHNFNVVADLQKALGIDATFFLENDANLAGLAEINGLTPTPRVGLYVTLSTGIGTGIIVNGHIDPTFHHSEGGKMLLEFGGQLRSWESFASGRAIYETYGQYAHDITDNDDWEAIATTTSRGLLAIIPFLQPEVVVIGGSIGTYFSHFEEKLNETIKDNLTESVTRPTIVQARHAEEAVIYGCFHYAQQKLS